MALKIRGNPNNLRKLEASVRAGTRTLQSELLGVVQKSVDRWAQGLIKAIESDQRFSELRSDPDLRGALGMAKQQFRKGSDTDAEDLIAQLRTYKLKTSRSIRFRKVNVKFPTLAQLEKKLTRNLSTISATGGVKVGPRQSWFRWWEFGDRGEITSLTVLRKNIGRIAVNSKGSSRSRDKLLKLIQTKSRSGSALQLNSLPAGASTGITGRNLVTEKYEAFARVFPARLGKAVNDYVRRNSTKISKFYTRATVR